MRSHKSLLDTVSAGKNPWVEALVSDDTELPHSLVHNIFLLNAVLKADRDPDSG
jgi:hypothetical protein